MNSTRLAKGRPQVQASRKPAQTRKPAAKPASTASAGRARRVLPRVKAISGRSIVASLQRTAIAVAARAPAEIALASEASRLSAMRRNAVNSRQVEIGRGNWVAPYPSGSQWRAYRNAATRDAEGDQPSAPAKRYR